MWKVLRSARKAYKEWKSLPPEARDRYSGEVDRIKRLIREAWGPGAVRFMEGSADALEGAATEPPATRARSAIIAELTQAVAGLSAAVAAPAGRLAKDSLPRSARIGGSVARSGWRRFRD